MKETQVQENPPKSAAVRIGAAAHDIASTVRERLPSTAIMLAGIVAAVWFVSGVVDGNIPVWSMLPPGG